MRIECIKCGEIVETTATTVVAPFVCDECNCDCGTCKPTMADANDMVDGDSLPPATPISVVCDASTGGCTSDNWKLSNSDKLYEYLFNRVSDFDLRAVFSRLNKEIPTLSLEKPESCDTASIENTTLLIEDLQQQLAHERAKVLALETELTRMKKVYQPFNEDEELVIAQQNFLEALEQIETLRCQLQARDSEAASYAGGSMHEKLNLLIDIVKRLDNEMP